MRIITWRRLGEAAIRHPDASSTIAHWYRVTLKASWGNLSETRRTFSHADQVRVESGKTVTIFNLTTKYRLIAAIHYDKKRIFILRVLTHTEYSKGLWKGTL